MPSPVSATPPTKSILPSPPQASAPSVVNPAAQDIADYGKAWDDANNKY